jgi:hypothetical protein
MNFETFGAFGGASACRATALILASRTSGQIKGI